MSWNKHTGRILVHIGLAHGGQKMCSPWSRTLARFHKSQIHIVHVVTTPEMARQLPPIQEDLELSNRIVARNREEATII